MKEITYRDGPYKRGSLVAKQNADKKIQITKENDKSSFMTLEITIQTFSEGVYNQIHFL